VPQIIKIAQNQSVSGLSLLSFELEQLAYTVHTSYGYVLALPFSAFGEAAVLVLQNTIILAQIYVLSRSPLWRPLLTVSVFGAALTCLYAGETVMAQSKFLGLSVVEEFTTGQT
jgi:mannose-P-dolichol utilization defect protein 1